MRPFPTSRYLVEAPCASVTDDTPTAVLVLRLALAVNALRSQQRYTLLIGDEPDSAAARRDRVLSFVIAAAFTAEALNILTGTGKVPGQRRMVELLAKAGKVPEDLTTTISKLRAGTHPASPLLVRIRNRLTFHWDPEVLSESLSGFQNDEPLIWMEGEAPTQGDSIYRLAADILANALIIERRDVPGGQEDPAGAAGLNAAIGAIADAMIAVSSYFEHAIAGYLLSYAARRELNE